MAVPRIQKLDKATMRHFYFGEMRHYYLAPTCEIFYDTNYVNFVSNSCSLGA